jgi:hypothetical protein
MRIKRNRKARNPKPRSRNAKDGEVDLPVGTYLATHHHHRCYLDARAGTEPNHCSMRQRRRADTGERAPLRNRSTAARSPSLGTRPPARGPAAVPPPSSTAMAVSLDLVMAMLGRRGRGKRERRKGGAGLGYVPGGAARHHRRCRPRAPATRATSPSFLCKRTRGGKGKEKGKQRREGSGPRPNAVRRSLDLAVAGGSPGRSLRPPPPVCCERCGRERKGLEFPGGLPVLQVFDRTRTKAGRRITDPR